MGVGKFFHHLFTPHCPECEHEKECKSCETLRSLLDAANFEKQQLLKQLLEITAPKVESTPIKFEAPEPIMPRVLPWKIRQQMLEAESRKAAQLTADKERELKAAAEASKQTTEELEKELGITGDKNAS